MLTVDDGDIRESFESKTSVGLAEQIFQALDFEHGFLYLLHPLRLVGLDVTTERSIS